MAFALAAALMLQEQLVRMLGSDRIEEREQAAREIRKRGLAALQELERAARDGDSEVAGRARHLGSVIRISARLADGLKAAMPGVVERLALGGSRAWTEVFLEASAELGRDELGGLFPEAVDGLETEEEAHLLLREVARHRVAPAGEAVVRLLDEECGVARAAARALAKLGWNRPSPEIVRLLESPDGYKRRIPLWAFRGIEMISREAEILGLMNSSETCEVAIRAAGEFNLGSAEPRLLEFLADAPAVDGIHECVADALGKIGTGETVSALLPLTRSREEGARKGAALALGELDALEAVPRLIELLQDSCREVRTAAATALGRMNAPEAVPHLLRLSREEDRDEEERLRMLEGLVELRVPEVLPGLHVLLWSENPRIREKAIDALGRLGARESAPKIACFLEGKAEDWPLLNVQASAVRALGRLEAKEAIHLLKDPEALCRMGVREAAGPLVEAVDGFLHGLRSGPIDEDDAEWAPLHCLNALREPVLWQKLQKGRIRGDWRGSTRELVERLAAQEGLALEIPETSYWKEDLWLLKSARIRSRRGQVPVLEALEELLPGEPFTFVLEPGRLRVLPTREALVFWKSWADGLRK